MKSLPEGCHELLIAESQITQRLHHVFVNGADLTGFPADLRLALQVAPSVGVVYAALEADEAKRMLLAGVISRVLVEERDVVALELQPGFEFDSEQSESPDSNPTSHHPHVVVSLILAEEYPHV